MKISWLHKNGNKDLVIFFSGWGIKPSDLEFLKTENFDVVMLHGINSKNNPEFNFCGYEQKVVVAFSFGVFLSGIIPLEADENFAFNGTLKPIDNNFGIKESIFKKTLENLSPETCRLFIRNMFEDDEDFLRFFEGRSDPDISELKQQLIFIDELSQNININKTFDKAFISKNDKIIPYRNQINFWTDTKTQIIDCGHFPFHNFSNWDEIIKQCRK